VQGAEHDAGEEEDEQRSSEEETRRHLARQRMPERDREETGRPVRENDVPASRASVIVSLPARLIRRLPITAPREDDAHLPGTGQEDGRKIAAASRSRSVRPNGTLSARATSAKTKNSPGRRADLRISRAATMESTKPAPREPSRLSERGVPRGGTPFHPIHSGRVRGYGAAERLRQFQRHAMTPPSWSLWNTRRTSDRRRG